MGYTEPSLCLTFTDFQIRVAEYLGLASYAGGAAAVPTDAHDLDMVKRICNDGWRRFVNAQPRWNWMEPIISLTLVPATLGTMQSAGATTFTDPARTEGTNVWALATLTITSGTGIGQTALIASNTSAGVFTLTLVSGNYWSGGITPDSTSQYKLVPANSQLVDPADNNRYYMPDGFFGQLIGFWTYPVVGPRLKIQNTHENNIRQLFAASGGVTGNPWLSAFRPLQGSTGTGTNRWEVLFYPTPLQSYVISARIRVYPNKLSSGSDVTNAGPQYDEAILAGMLAEAEIQRNGSAGPKTQQYSDAIQRAIAIDRAGTPARLGYNGDRSDDSYGPGRRPLNYYSVDSYNGNPV